MRRAIYDGKATHFYTSDKLIDFFQRELKAEFLSQACICCPNVCYLPDYDTVIQFQTNDRGTIVEAFGNLRRILQVQGILRDKAIKKLDNL